MKQLLKWWRRKFLIVELGAVVVGTLVLIAWAECFQGMLEIDRVLSGNRSALYGTLASIFGSLLGFAITAASIVLGFSSSVRLRVVRESRHFPTLWKVFGAAIRALGLATVVSLVGLVVDRDEAPVYFIIYLLVFSFLLSCVRIARTVWVLENIIALMTGPVRSGADE